MSIAKLPLLHDGRLTRKFLEEGLMVFQISMLSMQKWLDTQDKNWWKYYTIYNFQKAIEADDIRPAVLYMLYEYIDFWKDDKLFNQFRADFIATCYAFFNLNGDLLYPFGHDKSFTNDPLPDRFKNNVINENMERFILSTIHAQKLEKQYGTTGIQLEDFYNRIPENVRVNSNGIKMENWREYFFYLLKLDIDITKQFIQYAEVETFTSVISKIIFLLKKELNINNTSQLVTYCVTFFQSFQNLKDILPYDLATIYYAPDISLDSKNYSVEETRAILYTYFSKSIKPIPINGLRIDNKNNYLFWFLKSNVTIFHDFSDVQAMGQLLIIYDVKSKQEISKEYPDLSPHYILKEQFLIAMQSDETLRKNFALTLEKGIKTPRPFEFPRKPYKKMTIEELKIIKVKREEEEEKKEQVLPTRARKIMEQLQELPLREEEDTSSEDEDLRERKHEVVERQKKKSAKKEAIKLVEKMSRKGILDPGKNKTSLQQKLEQDIENYSVLSGSRKNPTKSSSQGKSNRGPQTILKDADKTNLTTNNRQKIYITTNQDPNRYFYVIFNRSRNNLRRVYWIKPEE